MSSSSPEMKLWTASVVKNFFGLGLSKAVERDVTI
jgi:hypothetical protein